MKDLEDTRLRTASGELYDDPALEEEDGVCIADALLEEWEREYRARYKEEK